MSKDIWHNADIKPEPFKTFVFKTDKGNTCSDMLSTNSGWNPILLPEFYSMDDFDKAERITKWCYLDDLLACEQELDRTRKALDEAIDELEDCEEWFGGSKIEKQFMLERIYKAYDKINEIKEGKDEC